MEKAKRLQVEIKKIFGDEPVNLVGGSVRDIIIGKEPKDWDYCTPLKPDTIEQKVRDAGRKPYLTGKRFGTIGFKVDIANDATYETDSGDTLKAYKPNWVYIEVTTYRTEKYDGYSRKPNVDFTYDLELDLSRRDFTMNAIVLTEDGDYFDPHGGRIDIISEKIKPVGKGKDRILEDPLRMLRAARFASQLGFDVDPNFTGVMRQYAHEITRVSKERWTAELDKLLMGKDPTRGIDILVKTDVMKYMIPEVWLVWKNSWAELAFAEAIKKGGHYDTKTKQKVAEDTVDERWRYLLYHIGYPYAEVEKKGELKYPKHEVVRNELIQGICARLKFSNERAKHLGAK